MRDVDNANVNVLEHQNCSDPYRVSFNFLIKKLDKGLENVRDMSFSKSSDLVDKFLFLLNHRLKDFKISNTNENFDKIHLLSQNTLNEYAPKM